MNYFCAFLFLFVILVSCQSEKQTQKAPATTQGLAVSEFDFNNFKIQKGQLGSIKLGMTIQEAESQFSGLNKQVHDAIFFGLDGGSPVYIYYKDKHPVFGLVPKLLSDTLVCIIAMHPKLETFNGIHVGASVSDLKTKYPQLHVYRNAISHHEQIADTLNDWYFTFVTSEDKEIGKYDHPFAPSKPHQNLSVPMDWIEIAPHRYW